MQGALRIGNARLRRSHAPEKTPVSETSWLQKATGHRSADIRGRIQTDGKKLMNENKRRGGGVFVTKEPRKDARTKAEHISGLTIEGSQPQ